MKKTPKTDTPEILCFASMGNEPGRANDLREFTPAARAMRRREIDAARTPEQRRQLLRSTPGKKPAAAPIILDKSITAAAQVEEMRKEATKSPLA